MNLFFKIISKVFFQKKIIISKFQKRYIPYYLKHIGVNLKSNVVFYGMPIVSMYGNSEILIDDNVVLCSESENTALGVQHPVVLRTLHEKARITIGNNSGLSGTTICCAISVDIGSDVLIGANVTIADTDFHPVNPINRRNNSDFDSINSNPIIIEDNVFIGCNSIILKGVTIGKNSIIGAGSVVTKSIPQDVIAAGNPVKILKRI
jgi:acetyltransferase-like isoleucine patch superfamily enzyme